MKYRRMDYSDSYVNSFIFYLQTLNEIVGHTHVWLGKNVDRIQVSSHQTSIHLAQDPFIEFCNSVP